MYEIQSNLGWTHYDDESVPEKGGCLGFAERNAIIDDIRAHGYLFSGWDHQESWDCVPILNDGERKNIICIHENLDPNVDFWHIVKNADTVREIIKGKASLVLQGHYHHGAESIVDGILYITLRAV